MTISQSSVPPRAPERAAGGRNCHPTEERGVDANGQMHLYDRVPSKPEERNPRCVIEASQTSGASSAIGFALDKAT